MAKDIFAKGYEVSRREKEKQDQARENIGKRLFRFFLAKDGDEADLIFLTEEPINFHEHTVKSSRNGKEVYETYTCSGDDCEFCNDGDRPSYKGAFLVYDTRSYETTDKNGKKKTVKGSVKLFVYGTKIVSQLDRLSSKYGLSNRVITMIRLGSGTSTTYTFERGDKKSLTEAEIKNMLPEKLRDEYDGSEDSLYEIVKEQLKIGIKNYSADDEDEDDEDDSDNESIIDLDDGKDDVPWKDSEKKSLKKKKSLFKKPVAENSVKKNPTARAKSLLKKN